VTETQITQVKIDTLLPYANNAREHTEEQVAQVAASIQEFGWTNPLIIHGNTVVAGHARLAAARKLGLKEVPVIDRSDMSEAQWKAYVLADNQLAQNATWNEGLLTLELDALAELDFDLDLLGFPDLDELMGNDEPEEGLTDPDDVPEPPADPITQPGDLWILGEHRLLCGDSTDAESVAYLMDGAKAELMLTDPPYGISVVGASGSIGKGVLAKEGVYRPVIGDNEPFDPRPYLDYAAVTIMFGANYFADKLPQGQWAVWDKQRPEGTTFSEAELIWTSNTGVRIRIYRQMWHGMTREGESGERVHPTQKPVDLIAKLIDSEETVFDPFLGSGTTLIAAQQLGRKCYGIEIDPIYCDVIIQRWENLTGQKAELAKPNDSLK